MLRNPHHKNWLLTKHEHLIRAWTDTLVGIKQRKRDMRFGTSNVRSLYKAVSLTAAARELARNKLDLVGVHEVRWNKRGHSKSREL